MDITELKFVELNQSNVTDDVIGQFDCGNMDMTEYLHHQAQKDMINGSSIFFKWFLEDLYYMSMNTIGFQMVFLRANEEGERLYRNNKFVDCDEYLSTYDASAEGCKALAITLTEIEEVIF